MNIHDILLTMSVIKDGEWDGIYRLLKEKVPLTDEQVREAYSRVKSSCLTLCDPEYPDGLKEVEQPPLALFYRCDFSLLGASKILACVGARKATPYTLNTVGHLVETLLEIDDSIVVISGLAEGVDSVCMRAAMKRGAGVIGVLGSGIDRVYPDSSQDIYDYCCSKKGLLLSEYPLSVAPQKNHFPFRNRIIAGLAHAVFAAQVGERSGTYVTVKKALNYGKNIGVLPQPLMPDECTPSLIKDGATPICSANDLLDLF